MEARWIFVFLLFSIHFGDRGASLQVASKLAVENVAVLAACAKSTNSRFVHSLVDMNCLKWNSKTFDLHKKFDGDDARASTMKSGLKSNVPTSSLESAQREARSFAGPPVSASSVSAPFADDFMANRRPLSVTELDALINKAMSKAALLNGKKPSPRQQAEICDGSRHRCHDLPRTCCDEDSHVVTPLNATSAITGKQVTVAQYPGLFIQTVVFSRCRYEKCAFIRGTCRQKFNPYLLMTVHPPGPVTIFGQDYVLVESGCACEPEVGENNRASLLSTNEFLNVLGSNEKAGTAGVDNAGA